MANTDAPFGLRPIKHLNGNPWNGQVQKYLVEDSYATAMFIGDPVILTGAAGSDDDSGNYAPVNVATAGDTNRLLGAVVGFEPNPDNLSRIYLPASTGGYVYVCNDPDVIFAVQDNAGAALTSASVGANAVLVAGTGSTFTGLSGWELNATTTPAANASYQVMITAVHNVVGNTVGENAIWEVLLSNHVFRGGQAAADEGALGI